ncbi:glucose-6-phosphate isomerase [Spirochaeta lutea]|uniref:Glucose-6-phosphate isomerase n=1 Tax=Spirochaeta lutea TaxID=1480694 RepID=A0A098R105_9SPIO|nr:glucose-6-phosphate isomerase [Spirochaeta lutea]KGE73451.1 glucose-6-phosphate isomerase [Spirochaeta lutea]
MSLEYKNFDTLSSYRDLAAAGKQPRSLETMLDAKRVERYEVKTDLGTEYLAYNYAAKKVDENVLELLQSLADEAQLAEKYRTLTQGEVMNTGENRKVLHHLSRGEVSGPVTEDGKDLGAFYRNQQQRIATFTQKVHDGTITTPEGTRFDTVVQIGIGGSDLGPRALYLALEGYATPKMKARFISNVDPDDAAVVLQNINPQSSLFILVSKSGTTQETLTNEALVLGVLEKAGIQQPRKQMICVTSETSPLAKNSEYLDSFFIDDYIGGRFSSTSAVGGAVLSLAYGPEVFRDLLDGAHSADLAALDPSLQNNPAMLDALIGVFERNFMNLPSTAILPYSQALSRFPAHLQQADMESNGKQVNRFGKPVSYVTGPVIFGEPGTNGQHSFYQLLHQGTDIIPLQFIGFLKNQTGMDTTFEGSTSQQKLNANLVAQIAAFALGKDDDNANKHFPGERPSSLLYADKLTPRVLGALLAHFENKIMFQGFLWNLNSFDQEGVQLGKVLTKAVLGAGEIHPALQALAEKLGAR